MAIQQTGASLSVLLDIVDNTSWNLLIPTSRCNRRGPGFFKMVSSRAMMVPELKGEEYEARQLGDRTACGMRPSDLACARTYGRVDRPNCEPPFAWPFMPPSASQTRSTPPLTCCKSCRSASRAGRRARSCARARASKTAFCTCRPGGRSLLRRSAASGRR